MSIIAYINKNEVTSFLTQLYSIELLLALYLLYFVFGMSQFNSGYIFYNEYRVLEVLLLLVLCAAGLLCQRHSLSKSEGLFFLFVAAGSFFWDNYVFLLTDLLLVYLLYKSFYVLKYSPLITKIIIYASLTLFLLLPIALWDYIREGAYIGNWYRSAWNIRVYDSYFLVLSIFAVWLYLTEHRYKKIYLLFLFLAFLAVLLDGGRSATLAYTLLIIIIAVSYRHARWQLLAAYCVSWLSYIAVTYVANLGNSGLLIARESSSGRLELWMNALQCWSQRPLFGCGFYQLDSYSNLPAHPHNLFIQVLTETGIIGFGFFVYILVGMFRRIDWHQQHRYFIMAALLAIGIDLCLSGVSIYPVTQIALLWLFVFLLKNPEFAYSEKFNKNIVQQSVFNKTLSIILHSVLVIWFIYLFLNTNAFLVDAPITPPRFWTYGYHLF